MIVALRPEIKLESAPQKAILDRDGLDKVQKGRVWFVLFCFTILTSFNCQ